MRIVSAADANRYFSRILRDVRAGETVVVTSRGEAVARIVPAGDAERAEAEKIEAERQRAWKHHIARLRSQPVLNIPVTWSRSDIYDDHF
ncbi:type II toxin-antitoxin system Phd/YefM family antitoxin [Enterovirga sp.]|uniref:type II toxin-antitoxin system Phd/YefM family antitoxin n=1 Tax=Enterovirga sp. TaxID=2026350 RepID=UPI002BB862E5|nr:type II toxin-antitoxin system Phd/YefM family antitoxin [Enterovirga sp.]HMO27734.1 type II toxin-antitoxin system Phd/YefM family antitoxin [Enterovirga sp.]